MYELNKTQPKIEKTEPKHRLMHLVHNELE